MHEAGVPIYGTSLTGINAVEDRDMFYHMLQKLDIPHIPGKSAANLEEAVAAARDIGYPVLVRPSYVIGGSGMEILNNETELMTYLKGRDEAANDTAVFPLLIDSFIPGREFEIDAVCDGKDVLIPGVFQHIERAGVHSGDSIAVFPAPDLSASHKVQVESYTKAISEELNLHGMVNIQFVLSQDEKELYVLEINPRASRTAPIASKVTGIPLIDLAVQVQLGNPLQQQSAKLGLHDDVSYFAVKMPVFSTAKLSGVDPYAGPEMQSTGEAIGLGKTAGQALAKACGWAEGSLLDRASDKQIYLSLSGEEEVSDQLVSILSDLSVKIAADSNTAVFLSKRGVTADNIIDIKDATALCAETNFSLICDTQKSFKKDVHTQLRITALAVNTPCLTSAETLQAYLYGAMQNQEAPVSISDYLSASKLLDGRKEHVM